MSPSADEHGSETWREDYWSFRADTVHRLAALEKAAAVEMVHRHNVEKRLAGIESTLRTLNWLVIGGFVSALVTFALSGGFHLP